MEDGITCFSKLNLKSDLCQYIPVHNTNIECVFPLMNVQWTKKETKEFSTDHCVKAMSQCKLNLDCNDKFYN